MSHNAIVDALKELHSLMIRYHRPQSTITKRLLDLRCHDAHAFDQMLQSDAVWSDPGCIWQVSFYESGLHSSEEARSDDILFHNAVVRLVEAMADAGLHHPRAASVGKTFCTWIRLNDRLAAS